MRPTQSQGKWDASGRGPKQCDSHAVGSGVGADDADVWTIVCGASGCVDPPPGDLELVWLAESDLADDIEHQDEPDVQGLPALILTDESTTRTKKTTKKRALEEFAIDVKQLTPADRGQT